MFSRKFSIRERADFLRAKNLGKCIKLRDVIVLYFVHNDASESCRLGYTATKKLGNAVCRNRVKRRLKNAVYSVFKDDQILDSSIDIVFIARSTTINCDWKSLIEQISLAMFEIKAML